MSNGNSNDIELLKFQYDKLLQSTYQDSTIAYVLFTLFFGFAAGMFIFTATLDIIIETIALIISMIVITLCNYIVDRFLIAGDIRRKAMLYLESKMKIDNFHLFDNPKLIDNYKIKYSNDKIKVATFGNFFRRWILDKNENCYKKRIDDNFIIDFKRQVRASEAIYFISLTIITGFLIHVIYRHLYSLYYNFNIIHLGVFIIFILSFPLIWYTIIMKLYPE